MITSEVHHNRLVVAWKWDRSHRYSIQVMDPACWPVALHYDVSVSVTMKKLVQHSLVYEKAEEERVQLRALQFQNLGRSSHEPSTKNQNNQHLYKWAIIASVCLSVCLYGKWQFTIEMQCAFQGWCFRGRNSYRIHQLFWLKKGIQITYQVGSYCWRDEN